MRYNLLIIILIRAESKFHAIKFNLIEEIEINGCMNVPIYPGI